MDKMYCVVHYDQGIIVRFVLFIAGGFICYNLNIFYVQGWRKSESQLMHISGVQQ